MKRVGILYHPMIEAAQAFGKELDMFLSSKEISVWRCSAWDEAQARTQLNDTDLILSVGGDGTILRSAQVVVPELAPITGINLGRLGFMTELSAQEAREKLPLLLGGKGWLDERVMLEAELATSSTEPPRKFYALNDVVIARGAIARLVHVTATIDGELFTTYKADGVIVATATGSTGYSLAAGGPILHPQAREFLLLPILPHLSPAYSLVLPSTAVVTLRVTTTHQATLSIDGHINLPLANNANVTIRVGAHKTQFLRINKASFYSSLWQRLQGR